MHCEPASSRESSRACTGATGEVSLSLAAHAAMLLDPGGVVTGKAAAALTWWPEMPVREIEVASRFQRRASAELTWVRRHIDLDLVVEKGGLRCTHPALTVLDLVPTLGGNAIDEALRRGATTLAELKAVMAAQPRRRGDRARQRLLDESRDEPWSEAERALQRRYRSLALPYPDSTNHRVDLPDGTYRLLDLAIPNLVQGFEADGFATHGTEGAFHLDRVSDAALATLNWQRIRFDASYHLSEDPEPTELMGAILAARESLFRGTRPAGARVRRLRGPR